MPSSLRWRGLLLALLLLSATGGARADAYFVIMFAAQREPPRPKYSHTFATFVHAVGQGPDLNTYRLDTCTISWLPCTLEIKVLALRREPGRALGLHETIRWALSTGQRVSMWGPYQIDADLYSRALKQVSLLQSGQVQYKALDSFHTSARVANCIHAVSSLTGGYRVRVVSPEWGEVASFYVLRTMKPWIIRCDLVYPCVATRLGLDAYPFIHRPFKRPRTGLFSGAGKRILGHEY